MVTLSSADKVLKNVYLGVICDQLNKRTNPFYAAIQQGSELVNGKNAVAIIRNGINGGVGSGTESGALPAAKNSTYYQLIADLKNIYGTIEISDKALRASQNSANALVNLLNDEMEALLDSAKFNFGRMLFGDGSGKLATVSKAEDGVYTVDTVRNLAVGQMIDAVNSSGLTVSYGKTITSVDRTNKTITLDGTPISIAECSLYIQGSRNLELTGLGAIFSDSDTLYGLTRSKHGWLKPYSVSTVGTLTENAIQKAIDMVEENGGGHINFIVCSWGVRRALFDLLSGQRTMEPVELTGGFKALSYNGIPVVADRFCPEGTMYLLNTDDFRLHQLCDWQWLEGENGKVLHQVSSKACYSATLVKYAELMCYRPCGQAVLKGITEK